MPQDPEKCTLCPTSWPARRRAALEAAAFPFRSGDKGSWRSRRGQGGGRVRLRHGGTQTDAKRGALDAWCCCPVPRSSQLLHGKRVCFMLGFALTCRLSATIRDLPWDAAGTFDRWRVWLVGAEKAFGRVERPARVHLEFRGWPRQATLASFLSGCSAGLKERKTLHFKFLAPWTEGWCVLARRPTGGPQAITR